MAITPKSYPTILKYGLQASYNAIETKDASVLYFCTDTKKIYKGDIDFTDSVVYAATKEAVTAPIVGKLYVFGTGTCEVYNGSTWTVVSYPIVTSDGSGTDINTSSTNAQVPSAKAVYDFVEKEIEDMATGANVVKSIAQKEVSGEAVEGTITYTTGDDVAHDVQLSGVVTTPSYDAETRTFTFPVTGASDFVVELGTDIFIDPTANNRYENGNLYLYLNDGSEGSNPTELVIPVTALVTDYFGDDTDSIQVDIDNQTHKVTAQAVIRPDSAEVGSEFINALKVSTAAGAKGLYVDLSGIEADITGLDTRLDTAEAAIDTLNGSNTTAGSVAKSIKDALADYSTNTIAPLELKVDQNTADIAALAAASTQWGTF